MKSWRSLFVERREKGKPTLDGILPCHKLDQTMFYVCGEPTLQNSESEHMVFEGTGCQMPSRRPVSSWLQKHYLGSVFKINVSRDPASKIQIHCVLSGPGASVFLRYPPGSPDVPLGWKPVAPGCRVGKAGLWRPSPGETARPSPARRPHDFASSLSDSDG